MTRRNRSCARILLKDKKITYWMRSGWLAAVRRLLHDEDGARQAILSARHAREPAAARRDAPHKLRCCLGL